MITYDVLDTTIKIFENEKIYLETFKFGQVFVNLKRKISTDGFSDTYEGHGKETILAIKLINYSSGVIKFEDIVRESKVMINIGIDFETLIDRGNQRDYIVTRYYNNNLHNYIKNMPKKDSISDLKNKLSICTYLFHFIYQLYSKKIVHHNINSKNIALTPDFEAFLINYDFGCSTEIDDIKCKIKDSAGTPKYQTIERINMILKNYDKLIGNISNFYNREDVYALSLVLIQLFGEIIYPTIDKKKKYESSVNLYRDLENAKESPISCNFDEKERTREIFEKYGKRGEKLFANVRLKYVFEIIRKMSNVMKIPDDKYSIFMMRVKKASDVCEELIEELKE